MKKRTRSTLWILFCLVILAIGLGVYGYISLTEKIRDSYAQWGTAEMIIAFEEENDKMPSNWENLSQFSDRAYHSVGLSFDEVRDRIVINFSELDRLREYYMRTQDVPEIIQTSSGEDWHWGGAEPNQLVNKMVRED